MLFYQTDCVLWWHKFSISRIWPPVWPLQATMKDKSISFSFSTLSWYRLMFLHGEVETRTLRCKQVWAHGQLITAVNHCNSGKVVGLLLVCERLRRVIQKKTSHCEARGQTGQKAKHTHSHSLKHTHTHMHDLEQCHGSSTRSVSSKAYLQLSHASCLFPVRHITDGSICT